MSDQLTNEIRATLAAARSQFEYLADLGLENQKVVLPAGPDAQNPVVAISGEETLDAVFTDLGDCQRCGLGASRTKLVYGVGNPNARLVLVGEAPGREEDLQGEPFVGEAGQLLDRILQAMGLQRGDVYICNVLKCRPPNNRDPQPEEVATCEAFLARQIAAIRPQVIIGLGRLAVHSLLKTKAPIGKLRGEWQSYQGIPLMPTYHPAYLLRNPEGKRDVWEDMKEVLRQLQSGDKGS
jgi:uracil-DNA glycosylase family 4